MTRFCTLLLALVAPLAAESQPAPEPSVARQWNEALLGAIRSDLARPTVHARNLFHVSAAMYDAWAAYDDVAEPYLLGQSRNGIGCAVEIGPHSAGSREAQEEAMSYAAYRLLVRRFRNSPGAILTLPTFDALMDRLGYDRLVGSTDDGTPSAVGNRIAECYIAFGRADGSNEARGYENVFYETVNPPLDLREPGNPDIVDLNRWQPLLFDTFIDQAGNVIPIAVPPFLGPEWGGVAAFALDPAARVRHERDGSYVLYADPGAPPMWSAAGGDETDAYLWGFGLVAEWSGHLDPSDGVAWDISPGALGNLTLPEGDDAVFAYYAAAGQGENGDGWAVNPATGQPYAPNVVPRGDYTRVLAEFWADGPDSETPPGHWFTLLNGVSDDPRLVKRWAGQGPLLDDLEWDVKTYFALGGAVHDAAVTAWGLKGWYDYIRPISAIRAVAALGQSTEPGVADYHPGGIRLVPGAVERIEVGDPLAGAADEFVGEIKIWGWRGPAAVPDPETDVGGVGWIRAAEWWPYQRPTFVTPPFAGYVSGHSTFSRAAAEVLTRATGDPFFPGGVGEFIAPADSFLVFEKGPSVDVVLQWATYRDAADQCSLSRIWGGIHPPADDLPGRRIGEAIGLDAVALAERFFAGERPVDAAPAVPEMETLSVYPSPVASGRDLRIVLPARARASVDLVDLQGRRVASVEGSGELAVSTVGLASGTYIVRARVAGRVLSQPVVVVR